MALAIRFYVALRPGAVDTGGVRTADALATMAVVAAAMALIGGIHALPADRARRLFTTPAVERRIDRTAGAALIGAGAMIAAR